MNIYFALSLFTLIILLYFVISEVFTILFRFTGLPEERARFQVVSLLTNCGFTTKESESFLSSRSRRRLVRITMLFGYVFNITVVSAIINVFFSLNVSQFSNVFFAILIPLVTVALAIIIVRIPKVRAGGKRLFEKIADKIYARGEGYNPVFLMDHIGADSIAVVTLNRVPDEIAGRSLAESKLRSEYGILVMLVEHPGKKAEAAGPDTVFSAGDKLTVFGNYPKICRVFVAKETFNDSGE